jgi:hypothetical protein
LFKTGFLKGLTVIDVELEKGEVGNNKSNIS